MRSDTRGFMLAQMMLVLAIIAIISVMVYENMTPNLKRANDEVCQQQARALQEHVDLWLSDHSIAAAQAHFQASGASELVPKDLAGLLGEVNQTLSQADDAFRTDDGSTIVSDALTSNNAYLTITWPIVGGSARNGGPEVKLYIQ